MDNQQNTNQPGYGYQQPGYGYQHGGYQQPGYGYPQPSAFTWSNAKPGIIPIRPLDLGDILNGTVSLLRYNPKTVLGLSAIFLAVTALINIFFSVSLGNIVALDYLNASNSEVPAEALPPSFISGLSSSNLLGNFLSFLLIGPLTFATITAVKGQKPSISEIWQQLKPNFWRFILTSITTGIILYATLILAIIAVVSGFALSSIGLNSNSITWILLGTLVFFILLLPLYYALYIKLIFAVPAATIQGYSPLQAIKYSWQLTRGAFWKLVGYTILFTIILTVATTIIATPLTIILSIPSVLWNTHPATALLISTIGGIVSSSIIQIITLPLSTGFITLLYVDQRIRKEGYDMEILSTSH